MRFIYIQNNAGTGDSIHIRHNSLISFDTSLGTQGYVNYISISPQQNPIGSSLKWKIYVETASLLKHEHFSNT